MLLFVKVVRQRQVLWPVMLGNLSPLCLSAISRHFVKNISEPVVVLCQQLCKEHKDREVRKQDI